MTLYKADLAPLVAAIEQANRLELAKLTDDTYLKRAIIQEATDALPYTVRATARRLDEEERF